jgi:hypothetical protein
MPSRTPTPKRVAWHDGERLFVIRIGTTTNAKIAGPKEKVVQTYTFDLRQLALVRRALDGKTKVDRAQFFALDAANCLDCPLSGNSGTGKCYTHKYMQFSGFVSMLKSLCTEDIPEGLDAVQRANVLKMCHRADYLRFGTYGEPSLLDIGLVGDMTFNLRPGVKYTGYTHQARKPWAHKYAAYFMASAHSDKDAVSITGWRSFVCVEKGDTSEAVQCPASKELSVTTCSACGLCSGIAGKGRKNIKIQMH